MVKKNLASVSSPSYNWSFILGIVAVLVLGLNIFILSEKSNSITGFAESDSGITNVTIEGYGIINFTTDTLSFGSGSVETGKSYAVLRSGNDSAAINASASWVSNSHDTAYFNKSLVIKNIGNKNFTNLMFQTDKNATGFIGGTAPSFKYRFSTNVSSCNATTPSKLGVYMDANETDTSTGSICAPFGYHSGSNHLFVDVELGIPIDSNQGTLTATIIASATGADYSG